MNHVDRVVLLRLPALQHVAGDRAVTRRSGRDVPRVSYEIRRTERDGAPGIADAAGRAPRSAAATGTAAHDAFRRAGPRISRNVA